MDADKKPKPRLAASSYLNSAPLIWSFTRGSKTQDVEYLDAVPSRCGELLAGDHVDFALVPIIEYQRIEGAKLASDVCVGSRERVRSVVLVSRFNNLKKVRSVALDESSRTSSALTRIIFKEFFGFEPAWSTSVPDMKQMLRDNDAALIIGDPAMTFDRDGLRVWDLASLWRDFTGTGFVFAMWMTRERSGSPADIDFTEARDEGLQALEAIIDSYEKALGLSRDEIREYLTRNITFELDDELRRGMQLYFTLAHKHGLIKTVAPNRL